MIKVQEHSADILVEYKKSLNVSQAILTVQNRIKAIEAEKAMMTEREAAMRSAEEAAAKVDEVLEEIEQDEAFEAPEQLQMPTEEQIEEELRKNFKMKGLILADVKVIKMHDKNLESGTSKLIPATLTKSGDISESKTNGVNKEAVSYTHLTLPTTSRV